MRIRGATSLAVTIALLLCVVFLPVDDMTVPWIAAHLLGIASVFCLVGRRAWTGVATGFVIVAPLAVWAMATPAEAHVMLAIFVLFCVFPSTLGSTRSPFTLPVAWLACVAPILVGFIVVERGEGPWGGIARAFVDWFFWLGTILGVTSWFLGAGVAWWLHTAEPTDGETGERRRSIPFVDSE